MSRLASPSNRRAAVAVCALALALSLPASASAAPRGRGPIEVHPGRDAISKALERARGGDTIRVHDGRYHESLDVTKRVRIVAAKGQRPVIDGGCDTSTVIAVRSAGVVLRGLTVTGGSSEFGLEGIDVDFSGVASGTARGLTVRNSCGHDVQGAAYGINVFSGRRMTVADNTARGFGDSGIYIGGITSTGNGTLEVRGNDSFGSNRGVIVEDSAGGTIVVADNELHDNRLSGEGAPAGLFLHNSDGVEVSGNTVTGNAEFGIDIDPTSDDNALRANRVTGNPIDLVNQGARNCGTDNRIGTSGGNVLAAC